jgi:hypothetical protein
VVPPTTGRRRKLPAVERGNSWRGKLETRTVTPLEPVTRTVVGPVAGQRTRTLAD